MMSQRWKAGVFLSLTLLLAGATGSSNARLPTGHTTAATPSQSLAAHATYRVVVVGFTATHTTWDHALEVDGKGDEVFLSTQVAYRLRGKRTSLDDFATPIMGDTNGFPQRVKVGSASDLGGIRDGDTFPSPLNKRAKPAPDAEVPPFELWADQLTQGKSAVVLTLTIWEYDGAGDVFGGWLKAGKKALPKLAALADKAISGKKESGQVTQWTELGLGLLSLIHDVTGSPGDRPVGTNKREDKTVFNPRSIILTYESAAQLARRSIGGVTGLISVQYRDTADLGGNYTLWLRIEKVR
jgi:hypothetical protein